MSDGMFWSDLRMPEPSLEPPYTSDPERWCDECRYSSTDGGSWWCGMYDQRITDLSEATECTGFRGAWL